jgi:WD40 repeat protein
MWGLAWSPDGHLLAYGTGSINFWDAAMGAPLRPLEQPNHANVAALAWSPDGRAIAASDDDASICLWEVAFGSQLAFLTDDPLKDDQKPIFAVAWSPDGRLLAASSPGGVRLWDVQAGQVAATLPAKYENEVPQSVAWSPDGRYLAAQGAAPKALWVYDRATGKQVHERWECEPYLHHLHLAWSPDGAFLATGDPYDQSIGLWDVQQGKLLSAFQRSDVGTNDLAWSPNGQYLAIASENHRVEVWALR